MSELNTNKIDENIRKLRNNILILEGIANELSTIEFDRLIFIKHDSDAPHHTYVVSECRECNSVTVQLLQHCLDGHGCGRCIDNDIKPITREQFDERLFSFNLKHTPLDNQYNIRIIET